MWFISIRDYRLDAAVLSSLYVSFWWLVGVEAFSLIEKMMYLYSNFVFAGAK